MQIFIRISVLIALMFCLMGASKREYLSRIELTHILKKNDFLCYGLKKDGSCSLIIYPAKFKGNIIDLYLVILDTTRDNTVLIERRPMKWTGDRLCIIPGKLATEVLYSKETLFSFPHDKRYQAQNSKIVKDHNDWYGNGSDNVCFAYIKTKYKRHLIELEYIGGVVQKNVETVTIFKNKKGRIRLRK